MKEFQEKNDDSLLEGDATGTLLLAKGDLSLNVFRDGRQERRLYAVTILVRNKSEGGDGAVGEGEAVGGKRAGCRDVWEYNHDLVV